MDTYSIKLHKKYTMINTVKCFLQIRQYLTNHVFCVHIETNKTWQIHLLVSLELPVLETHDQNIYLEEVLDG